MIRKAALSDARAIAQLAAQMWSSQTADELQQEFQALMTDEAAALFVCTSGGANIGFAQCQLRHDYVEGTDSSPVGYLEGIFVLEQYRHLGIAKKLLAACETWARNLGCCEFASDCELDNSDSLKFHLNVGFEEANRIICFAKKL